MRNGIGAKATNTNVKESLLRLHNHPHTTEGIQNQSRNTKTNTPKSTTQKQQKIKSSQVRCRERQTQKNKGMKPYIGLDNAPRSLRSTRSETHRGDTRVMSSLTDAHSWRMLLMTPVSPACVGQYPLQDVWVAGGTAPHPKMT